MNILIVGCGKVGSRLANILADEGHDVSVVDHDEKNLELLGSDFSGFTTVGVEIDQDVLKSAGIESCDALAALSNNDNVNIMVSQLAGEIFKVPNVLARIYDPQRENIFSHFGLHTVCPTNLTVSAVKSTLVDKAKIQSLNFGDHTINFQNVEIDKSLIGSDINDLEIDDNHYIFAINHDDGNFTIYQNQKYRIRTGDTLIICEKVD